jgi:uncharacterized protein Yka (UPF0111/DUF47 family)
MSERQVQHTDGSWSREVEVTDDAVEAATRLLSGDMAYTEENIDRTLRALVERVQEAEAERDAARGKLDKVRERVKFHLSGQRNGSGISFILDDVLAILDGNPA